MRTGYSIGYNRTKDAGAYSDIQSTISKFCGIYDRKIKMINFKLLSGCRWLSIVREFF